MSHPAENITNFYTRIKEPIIALDTGFAIVYINDSAAEILSKPATNLIGKNFWIEFPRQLTQPLYQGCLTAMNEQRTINVRQFSSRFQHWFEIRIYPDLTGVSIVLHQLQDAIDLELLLRDAEAENHRARERFALVAKATNDMIWDWDLITNKIWWNYNYNDLFGFEQQTSHDVDSWVKSIHPEDRDRVEESIYRIVNTGQKYWSAEYRYLKPDGTVLNILDRGFVAHDEWGNPYRMIGSMLNVTDRIKTEDSLKASEEKYRTLVQQASDAIFIVDDQGRFYTVNESACRMTQYSEAELLKMKIYDFSVKEDIEVNPYRFSELKQGITVVVERIMSRKDGVIFNVEITAKVLSSGLLLVFARDITEKKKAEVLLKQTLDNLRNLASHLTKVREEERRRIGREIHDELGQQLTAVKMDIAWMDKKISNPLDPMKAKLKNVITLLDSSNQSVRRILMELNPGIIDNHGLLNAFERQNKQFTSSTGIPVDFSSSHQELKLGQEMANSIFRIYQESLTNIMRYAKATKVKAYFEADSKNIKVEIEDNGQGFDISAISQKKSFGILGMRERLLALNGTFELKSTIGKGTTILLNVPLTT